jgi:hypothetical protein
MLMDCAEGMKILGERVCLDSQACSAHVLRLVSSMQYACVGLCGGHACMPRGASVTGRAS